MSNQAEDEFITIMRSNKSNQMETFVKMPSIFFPLYEQLQQLHLATSTEDCVLTGSSLWQMSSTGHFIQDQQHLMAQVQITIIPVGQVRKTRFTFLGIGLFDFLSFQSNCKHESLNK